MTLAIAALALGLTLGQTPLAGREPASPAAPAEDAHAASQAAPAAQGEVAPGTAGVEAGHAASHGEAAHGEPTAHGEAAAHGGAGAEKERLDVVMMHHVANGETLEFPGFCHGGFAWDCEIDLNSATHSLLGFTPSFTVAGITFDMTPSRHVVMMWIAAALLVLTLFAATRRRALVPHGLYNFFELLVQFVRDEIAVKNIGARDAARYTPFLCTAFFFILFMNLLGLVPWMATATANLAVTMALSLFTFILTQAAGIRTQGLRGYLAHLTGGVPKSLWPLWAIMVPVELLGLFTKPFALTVRLFANMVAGHFVILALLGLIFAVSVGVAPASVAMAIFMFMLELFVAFVQAYIFTMLSSLFIGSNLVHHGGHEHGGNAGDHASHVVRESPGHG